MKPVFDKYAKTELLHTMQRPGAIRKKLYRHCTLIGHGYLGSDKRVEHPKCIGDGLNKTYPNPIGVQWMGHKNKCAKTK